MSRGDDPWIRQSARNLHFLDQHGDRANFPIWIFSASSAARRKYDLWHSKKNYIYAHSNSAMHGTKHDHVPSITMYRWPFVIDLEGIFLKLPSYHFHYDWVLQSVTKNFNDGQEFWSRWIKLYAHWKITSVLEKLVSVWCSFRVPSLTVWGAVCASDGLWVRMDFTSFQSGTWHFVSDLTNQKKRLMLFFRQAWKKKCCYACRHWAKL